MKLINIKYPISTNTRLSYKNQKIITGKMNLFFDKKNDFIFNKSFSELKIIYDKKYNNEQSELKIFRKHLLNVFNIIKSRFDKNTSIIEVGCGKGFFFSILEKNFNNIRGFDKTYNGNNKKIKKRYLKKSDIIYEKLIVLRHTLEHIPNPYNFLKMLKSISVNNPYILIEVPDLDWIRKNQTYFDIAYDHVNYFTLKTFERLFYPKKLFFKKQMFGDQYIVILARLNDLNINYRKTIKARKINITDIFPTMIKKIREFEKIKSNIYIWGTAAKGLMFSIYLKYYSPKAFKRLKYAVDINKQKQKKYLQISKIKILSPKELISKILPNDIVCVANSIYLKEVKQFLKSEKTLKKLKVLPIDL